MQSCSWPPLSSVSLAAVKRFAFAGNVAFCSNAGMTPKEHLIQCLKALCDANGGPEGVAEKAEISADNLKQIIAGTKLPKTGEPRGIGPLLQKKLDASFPGWAKLADPKAPQMLSAAALRVAVIYDQVSARDRRHIDAAADAAMSPDQPGEAATLPPAPFPATTPKQVRAR